MIILHRLNGKEFAVNAELLKFVEATPDTVITLQSKGEKDEKLMVKESVDEIIEMVVAYKKKCSSGLKEKEH